MNVDKLIADIRAMEPGKNWNNWCQLVAWYAHRVTGTPKSEIVTYPTARAAYRASSIVSRDPESAPAGAFHYWENPDPEGHVAVALGNGRCLMASGVIGGDHLGVIGVAWYTAQTGNPYLGWSYTNGKNEDIRGRFRRLSKPDYHYGLGRVARREIQLLLRSEGLFRFRIGRAWGATEVRALQTWLKRVKYLPASYVTDGLPGIEYGKALQRLARKHGGYTGPIDGRPGGKTSAALGAWLKKRRRAS